MAEHDHVGSDEHNGVSSTRNTHPEPNSYNELMGGGHICVVKCRNYRLHGGSTHGRFNFHWRGNLSSFGDYALYDGSPFRGVFLGYINDRFHHHEGYTNGVMGTNEYWCHGDVRNCDSECIG